MKRDFRNGIAATCLLIGSSMFVLSAAGVALAAKGDNDKSQEFVEDAQQYLDKGDINAAVIQLKNALQQDPNNVSARKLLGEIYLQVGNGPAAEKELKAAQQRGAKGKDLQIQIARAYMLQRKFDKVLKELKYDVTDPKDRLLVLLARGQAYLGINELEDAERTFTEAEKLKDDDIQPKIGLARILAVKNKVKEAEAKIDAALAIKADSAEALVLKGGIRRLNRDLEGAVQAFDKAVKANKGNLRARLGRAAALIDLNKDVEAEADLQAVFQRSRKHPLANYLSALSLAKKKDFAGAQEAVQRGGPSLDNHMPSVFLSGAINYGLNQLEQAAANLGRFVGKNPKNVRARKLLGATLVRKNESKKAIEILEPLVTENQADAQVKSLLGSAYMRTGKFAKGAEMFEQAAKENPKKSAIRTQLALSRLAQGSTDQAVGDLEAAINLDPDANQASVLLALVHLRKGKFDDALKAAEALKKSMPENPLALNLIGASLLGKGSLKEARASFEEALRKKPEFHPARMNLAQLDLREKKDANAMKHYNAIISADPKHIGALMALANIAAKNKQDQDVVKWLKQAGEANPKSVAPRLQLIRYYNSRRSIRKALSVARSLNTSVPRNPQLLEALGRAEVASNNILNAVGTFRELVDVVPKSPRAHQLLGDSLVASKDPRAARESFNKSLELDKSYVPTMMRLAELESREGNLDKALELAQAIDGKRPKFAAGKMLAGDAYVRAKQFKKALVEYDAGLKKVDTGALAIRRFNAQRQAESLDKALAGLQTWVDRKNEAAVRHVLASNYISNKRYDDAIRESEKLLKDDQDNPVLLNNLAWLYSEKKDPRAAEFGKRALDKAPKSAAVMDTLGWILLSNGDIAKGTELLKKANEAAPKQGDIAYHYAIALQKGGKTREAKRLLDRLIAQKGTFSDMGKVNKLLKELGG
ncbi:MAG: PEP-CTERM system TPR-repeat protein PrsT [Alphaproteobacteria bacterium]|nr:PEP-CTERM system TPR-repeat protein PrsT [Alphaproteobacteria bacterium]